MSLAAADAPSTSSGWLHLSSYKGDLAPPNSGKEQTSATVFDIDKDGLNDFVITERTAAPSVVWYRRTRRAGIDTSIENAALTARGRLYVRRRGRRRGSGLHLGRRRRG